MLRGLIGRLRGRPAAAQAALRGRPAIRREKTFAADSGYVYQYTYEGFCDARRDGLAGRDYVFRCTSDRSSRITVTVFAASASFEAWEREAGRNLNEVERYAVVKMRLFGIFDASVHVTQDIVEPLTAEDVSEQVEALDL